MPRNSARTSTKFPALEYIFNKLTSDGTRLIGQNHAFTIVDMLEAYEAVENQRKRMSISNTILDLTRKDKGIERRLPPTIIQHGYDLRKKTGPSPSGANYMGEFVYVGVGNALKSWLVWNNVPDRMIEVDNLVPAKIIPFLSKDEGALFSVIDYCDILSHALFDKAETVFRIQNPMKWQPNEIDGLYFSDADGQNTLFPCEAKALSTEDDINLEQMLGGYRTINAKVTGIRIVPLALQMTSEGVNIGVLRDVGTQLELERFVKVIITPPIQPWQARKG